MAGIDKTYTNSYQQYKELVDWASDKVITFNYGKRVLNVDVSNYIYDWKESDFDGRELPIMNTPTWFDVYMYKNCPCQFVIDRLNEVYNGVWLSQQSYGEIQPELKQNRKITIVNDGKFRFHNTTFKTNIKWWVHTTRNTFWYSEDLEAWVNHFNFPSNSNVMTSNSIKSIVRKLRKMYLPEGIEFRVSGAYIGENYTIKISK